MSNYRAPLRTLTSDWRAGEIDPKFNMRVDTKALPSGARRLRNMLLSNTGGAARRPGTAAFVPLLGRCRLVEFEFDADEKYIVGFEVGRLVVFNQAGALLVNLGGQPWNTTAITWELNVVQKGDVMIVVHNKFQMRRLRRTSATTFIFELVYFSADAGENVYNQPYIRYQKDSVRLAVDDTHPGPVTLTSSPAIFTSAWAGERIRIYEGEVRIDFVNSGSSCDATVMSNVRTYLDAAPFRFTSGNMAAEVTHAFHGLSTGAVVTVEGAGAVFNLTAAQLNGNHSIVVIDSDRYRFTMTGTPPDTSGDGGGARVSIRTVNLTSNWKEQVWSARHGWPGAIALHENRLWLGGGTDLPTFLGGSAVGDYYDFSVRDGLDDESVQGVIASLSKIVHLVSAKTLQIFCEGEEDILEVQDGVPITPGTLKVTTQTKYGVDPNVRPRIFDGATIFAQRNGKNVREFIYDFNTDSQVSSPVSVIASHLINKPNDVAVLLGTPTRPEQYAFYVNADGTCAVFHSIRSEQLAAWTLFTAGGGGKFDSVCVIGSSVYFSVLRGASYWLERFELDVTDIWLDGAVRLTGGPATVWTLPSSFDPGQVVTVMAGGWKVGDFTVSGGNQITLPSPVAAPIVGFDYGVQVIPMPPDKELTDGPLTGEIRRVLSTTIHFHETVSAAVNGVEMLGYATGQDPSIAPVKVTDKRKIRMLGYGRDPVFVVTQPNPGPLNLLGLTTEMSV
jgi:hypothetical protein